MSQRIDFMKASPNAAKGFLSTSAFLTQCSVPITIIDLVYLRVSQINGCAYCIDMHSRDLRKHGMSVDKLMLVSAWREGGALFDAREAAALAWAEALAVLPPGGVADADFEAVSAVFDEREVVDLTVAVGLMSAFNRLGVGLRLTPAAVTAAAKEAAAA
ncbi:MAG: carboxymuconolactone decarboxylase family protein [Variovorax sp.]|nr:MAG: carboxymuconolactone decarboxylase family protein [Variovorax sp.]